MGNAVNKHIYCENCKSCNGVGKVYKQIGQKIERVPCTVCKGLGYVDIYGPG